MSKQTENKEAVKKFQARLPESRSPTMGCVRISPQKRKDGFHLKIVWTTCVYSSNLPQLEYKSHLNRFMTEP
jgi:hypothetical protein